MNRTVDNIYTIYECESEGVISRARFLWGGMTTKPMFHSPYAAHEFLEKYGLKGVDYVVGPIVP